MVTTVQTAAATGTMDLTTGLTVTLSSSPTAGNILIAFVALDGIRALATPSGWQCIQNGDVTPSAAEQLAIMYRRVESGDGTSYTFKTVTSSGAAAVHVEELSGADGKIPIVHLAHNQSSGTSVAGQSTEEALRTGRAYLVVLGGGTTTISADPASAAPGTWTEEYQRDGTDPILWVGHKDVTKGDTFGTFTFTFTASVNWHALQFILADDSVDNGASIDPMPFTDLGVKQLACNMVDGAADLTLHLPDAPVEGNMLYLIAASQSAPTITLPSGFTEIASQASDLYSLSEKAVGAGEGQDFAVSMSGAAEWLCALIEVENINTAGSQKTTTTNSGTSVPLLSGANGGDASLAFFAGDRRQFNRGIFTAATVTAGVKAVAMIGSGRIYGPIIIAAYDITLQDPADWPASSSDRELDFLASAQFFTTTSLIQQAASTPSPSPGAGAGRAQRPLILAG